MGDDEEVKYGFATWNVKSFGNWYAAGQVCTHMTRWDIHLAFVQETKVLDGPKPQRFWSQSEDNGRVSDDREWFNFANSSAVKPEKGENQQGVGFVWRSSFLGEYISVSRR